MPDLESKIHNTEVWTKTNCLEKEHQTNLGIFDQLRKWGWSHEKTDHFRTYRRNNKTVIVCLVDDVRTCSQDYKVDLPYLFDRNTTVITDNYFTCPTVFSTITLPVGFFGIYSYKPDTTVWTPRRDFAFQVNRVDARRVTLMIDLGWRTQLDLGYVNFNCEDRTRPNMTPQEAFAYHGMLGPDDHKYQITAAGLTDQMPFKNYNIPFDLVPYQVWINIVIETYSSDTTVALSEKIFRALVTPAPWTVYSGRYTVARLESLGFDCMSDMIDHNRYDRLKEVENKLGVFNWISLEIVKHLKDLGEDAVRQRCLQASKHNQQLLQTMAQQWPTEFSSWIDTLPSRLDNVSNQ